jgi:murein DD-endopeptidase MepM/ murein hydrolase activator NlpD
MRYSLKAILHTAFVVLTVGSVATAKADNKLVPPAAHQAEHTDLIAGQLNIGNQIKVDATEKFLEDLFPEEEEPESDIYTEGWSSNLVNCYSKAIVPDKMNLDVAHFHMPTAPTYITSPYGYRRRFRRMHKGVDLKVQIGDTIYAAFDGRVRLTKFERKGYGYYVVLRHTNDMETVYGHLSRFLVKPDQYVKAGDPIALGGNTGHSTGPHLHFETRYMGYAINPQAIFDFANNTTHTDTYTFTKNTYMNARDYAPNAATYAAAAQNAKASASRSASAGKGKAAYYTVRRGDTLSRIAAHHGTTVSKLCRLNGLSASSRLKVGKKIRLK